MYSYVHDGPFLDRGVLFSAQHVCGTQYYAVPAGMRHAGPDGIITLRISVAYCFGRVYILFYDSPDGFWSMTVPGT